MTDKLCLHLFGVPQFIYEDEPVTGLAAKKTRALLIYLAVTGRPHSRDALANLLWADKPKTARQNLKKAISTLRKNPLIPLIEQSDRLLRLDSQQIWIDIALFETAANDAPNQSIDQLQQAIALYIDDFLAGFNISISLEFEAWALEHQNKLKADSLIVLQHLAQKQEKQGDVAGAVESLQKYLRIEPWHEETHRRVMWLLARMGNRGAALQQYDQCCDALRIELDVEPAPQTVALMEKIRRNKIEALSTQPESATTTYPEAQTRDAFRRSNLPAVPDTMFGREKELEQINYLITENEARLVTILGIGGIGKTQLAVTAAQAQVDRFADGVLWVPLAALSQADDIPFAIGDVLQYQFQGKQTPEEQIIALLRDRQMLLVLDNFEHLLDGAQFIANILVGAPQVSILATSRERLKLLHETVLQLEGLDYPGAHYETKADYPAVRLFMTQMHRVRPEFMAEELDRQAIVEICQLVQGTPLGILLAASWGSILKPIEILAEVRKGLDILETDLQDIPQRQRSIRIVFEQTWTRLSEDERNVLMRLSIFRGGFTHEAAEVVAGATLPLLLGLYDKALIGRAPNGRFDLHELLRQFAEERLIKADLADESRDAHGEHYLNLVADYEAKLKGNLQLLTLNKFKSERENIRQAWDRAVTQVQIEQLVQATEGLCVAYHLSDSPVFGESACRKAIMALASISMPSSATSTTEIQHARAKLLIWHSKFSRELGGASLAQQLLEESLDILAELDAAGMDVRAGQGAALSALGDLVWYTDVRSARKMLTESLDLCCAAGDQWQEAYVLREFARSSWATGELETGESYIQESLHLRRKMHNQFGIRQSLAVASWIAIEQGKFNTAMGYTQELYQISQQIGGVGTISEATFNLGIMYLEHGEFSKARSRFIEAQRMAKEVGKRHHENTCTISLSRAEVHLGNYAKAIVDAQTVLRVADEINLRSHRGDALIHMGRACLVNGDCDSAVTHASESLAIVRENQQVLKESLVLDLLGLAELAQGNHEAARNHLTRLLGEFSNHRALIHALPLAALLLLDEGQVAYADQLYSIAKRYPLVANSRWYADVVGKHIDAAVSSSSGNPINLIEFEDGQELHQIVPWIFDALSLHQHPLAS